MLSAGFWVGFSFIFLLVLFYKFGVFSLIISFLDKKIQSTFNVIEQAKQLKNEAENALAIHTRQQNSIETEINNIISQAKIVASNIEQSANHASIKYIEQKNVYRKNMLLMLEKDFINNIKQSVAEKVYFNIRNNFIFETENIDNFKLLDNFLSTALKK
jgi:F0F1-type ATP synthase membrane subunit b/b'